MDYKLGVEYILDIDNRLESYRLEMGSILMDGRCGVI